MCALVDLLKIWRAVKAKYFTFTVQFWYRSDNEQRSYMRSFKNPKAIYCHASRVNRSMKYLENQSVHGVTISVQTFCGLKEIPLVVMEL